MIDFLAAKYVVDLIMNCYCFCQFLGLNSFVFLCSYVSSFVLKRCVADEKAVDCTKIDEMLSIVILNTTSKTPNTIITSILFDLFSYFGVPVDS